VAPLPFLSGGHNISLDLLGFQHTSSISNGSWPLIEVAETVRVLKKVRLGKLDEVPLAECKSIVVYEFVGFRHVVLGSRLFLLFTSCKSYLGLSDVRDTLDRDNAASLSQFADWRHLSGLESLSASQL